MNKETEKPIEAEGPPLEGKSIGQSAWLGEWGDIHERQWPVRSLLWRGMEYSVGGMGLWRLPWGQSCSSYTRGRLLMCWSFPTHSLPLPAAAGEVQHLCPWQGIVCQRRPVHCCRPPLRAGGTQRVRRWGWSERRELAQFCQGPHNSRSPAKARPRSSSTLPTEP